MCVCAEKRFLKPKFLLTREGKECNTQSMSGKQIWQGGKNIVSHWLPWSSCRLLRCLCRSASCQECFLVICYQCNTTNHPPIYIFLYQYFSCTQCCWLAGARGGVTLWTKASTDEPTITHTRINTWKLHTGSKGRKQMHNLLVLRLQHQQGDQYNNTISPKKTLSSFFGSSGFGVSAALDLHESHNKVEKRSRAVW